jgi:hypothetical protein
MQLDHVESVRARLFLCAENDNPILITCNSVEQSNYSRVDIRSTMMNISAPMEVQISLLCQRMVPIRRN